MIAGLVINTTPHNVSKMVNALNTLQDSLRKRFANMATNTGVEKIITDASANGMCRKA